MFHLPLLPLSPSSIVVTNYHNMKPQQMQHVVSKEVPVQSELFQAHVCLFLEKMHCLKPSGTPTVPPKMPFQTHKSKGKCLFLQPPPKAFLLPSQALPNPSQAHKSKANKQLVPSKP